MDINLIIDVLKWVVPTSIAVISLVYVIKQRSVVKKEISRKRYLENALSSLNESLKSLRSIEIPDVKTIGTEEWEDTGNDLQSLTSEVLRASFNLKTKKVTMSVSYSAKTWRILEKGKTSEYKSSPLSLDDQQGFADVLRTTDVYIESKTDIANYTKWVLNDPSFEIFMWSAGRLRTALQGLMNFEEVYESLSPDCVKRVEQILEDLANEIFSTVSQPKAVEIDLTRFSTIDEIATYLCEQILNYPNIAKRFSKVSESISELTEARKQLFLKIS